MLRAVFPADISVFCKVSKLGCDLLRRVQTSLSLILPHIPDLLEYANEPRVALHSHGRFWSWPICSAEDRLEVGCDEGVQRPTSTACGSLDIVHVYAINIGALFAIDLNGYEVLVQDVRDFLVLERLALHDMTPMAGRISDAYEDESVGLLGQLQRFWAPLLPCDRIVHVAAHIRAPRLIQAVFKLQAVARGGRRAGRVLRLHSEYRCVELSQLRSRRDSESGRTLDRCSACRHSRGGRTGGGAGTSEFKSHWWHTAGEVFGEDIVGAL